MTRADATLADLAADPHSILAAARAEGAVTWFPALGAWVVTERATAVAVMRDPERFTVDDHKRATQGVECRKDEHVLDETPGAYKDIDAVMKAQSDLVEPVYTLRQVGCVKG